MNLKILDIREQCTACGACVSVCAKEALTLQPTQKIGFYYPVLDESRCVECHLCEKICHVLSSNHNEEVDRHPFLLKAKDKSLLKRSSSGGAFSLLATKVLVDGGIVYGAAYNYEVEKLEESSTERVDLDALRKSKYIESYCGNIFKDVEQKVREKKKILFCGTPCQIKGLRHYLTTKHCDASNILLVQFLCHGVPSNQFFTEYKHWLEKQCKVKIMDMDFRSKKYGWRTPYYYYYYGTGSKTIRGDATYYMSAFFKYYMLRDSCYGCTIFDQGYADLTIADFWGLSRYDPSNKDNEGISLAITHNEKANQMLLSLGDVADIQELPLSAIEYTRRPHKHVKEQLTRKKMMEEHVFNEGYMPYMEKLLAKDVRKGWIKDIIAKFLFKTGIWKTNE